MSRITTQDLHKEIEQIKNNHLAHMAEDIDELNQAVKDNREFFIDRLDLKQVEYLLAHEVLHVAFEHMLRRGEREPQAWNVACDYAINQILEDEKIGRKPTGDDAPLLDSRYRGMAAEDIYGELEEWTKTTGYTGCPC